MGAVLKLIEDKRPFDLCQNSHHTYSPPRSAKPQQPLRNPTTTTITTPTTASLIPLYPLNAETGKHINLTDNQRSVDRPMPAPFTLRTMVIHVKAPTGHSSTENDSVQKDSGTSSTNSSQKISSYVPHSTRLLLETYFSSDSVRDSEWISLAKTTRPSPTTNLPHAPNSTNHTQNQTSSPSTICSFGPSGRPSQ
jgi:hypothetical protein